MRFYKNEMLPIVLVVLASGSVNAANDKPIEVNGKPFQLLNEQIQQNTTSISELAGRVSTIESKVTTLQSDVSALQADMASIQSQVLQQAGDIKSLMNTTGELAEGLETLILKHESDFNNLTSQIAGLSSRIGQLETAVAGAKQELQSELDVLAGDLSNLDSETSAKIAELSSEIEALNAALDEAKGTMVGLQTASNTLLIEIDGMKLRLDAVEGRVSTLESYHGAKQCDKGNDTGTGSRYVVCEADPSQAWISADSNGTYHAELICQQLGYRTVSIWSGTCGNVCGYCQGATSCDNPGAGPEHESRPWSAFNAGSDTLGPMIAFTVQWRCVK